ncbi:hypothetical protein Y032_0200g1679 [Ancylostoma ceylanicum]|uniref:Uncharacterized protein n=1 Tax=Ancylostoma ceylanicum TaxID=53326 RepID=A0A016SNH1_9BILA|nr:hypothetical protein Y032_0200g1679 [Ancylostoma ceylanicum]
MIKGISYFSSTDQWLGTDVSIAVLQATWILFLYCNPILLITLNPTIRKKVLQFIACPLRDHRTPTVISSRVNKSSIVQWRSQSHKR